MVASPKGELLEALTASFPFGRGKFEVMAAQRGPSQTVVNPPQTARLPGLFDLCGIHQAVSAHEKGPTCAHEK